MKMYLIYDTLFNNYECHNDWYYYKQDAIDYIVQNYNEEHHDRMEIHKVKIKVLKKFTRSPLNWIEK